MSKEDDDSVIEMRPPRVLFEVGGPVDACSATLCIYHEDLDPDEMTRRLGVNPTTAFRRGFQRRSASRPMPHGAWLLRVSEPSLRTVEDQLHRLLMQLVVAPDIWATVVAEHRVRISVGLHMSAWNRGFALSPTILAAVAKLNVELDFDVYVYDDTEDG
ncbi:MAG: DUF4279 domain-containing protein [Deltaproteobacteria bacterium]|nr:DUF4279 domain-containing protein [Deltaproteobacteria bacterium]